MKKFLGLLLACLMAVMPMALAEAAEDDVVAEVNGATITKAQVSAEYEYYVAYYESYGVTDEDSLAQLRDELLNYYVQDLVIEQKIDELNIAMPAEESILADAQKSYDETLFTFISQHAADLYTGTGDVAAASAAFTEFYAANSDMTVEDAIAAFSNAGYDTESAVLDELMTSIYAYLDDYGYSHDGIIAYTRQSARTDALNQYVLSSLTITDEDVRAYYDEQVATAKETYDADPGALETDVQNSEGTTLYVPEGYRYIKQILVLMESEDQNTMYFAMSNASDCQTQIDSLTGVTAMDGETYAQLTQRQSEIATRLTEIESLLLNDDADIDALTTEQETLQTESADVDTKLASDEAKLYTATTGRDEAMTTIAGIKEKYQPQVDAIYERLTNGEDFDALILELGEDPGMLNAAGDAVVPYMVYEGTSGVWEENFAAAAVALEVGKYSTEPVWTSYGAHIVYYDSPAVSGAVEYDTVKDELTQAYTDLRQQEACDQQVAAWVADSDITTYPDKLLAE